MPFVEIIPSVALSSLEDERALTLEMSGAVAQALGKPETDLMVRLCAPAPMVFRRAASPCCLVRIRAIGEPTGEQMCDLIAKCTDAVCAAFGMPEGQVLVTYTEEPRVHWGVAGKPH